MSRNERGNLFFSLTVTALTRFQFKVPLLDGPSYIYRACERKRWCLIQSKHFLKPALTLARSLGKSAVQRKERVKNERERARDFCDDDEEKLRSSVACFDGVRVRGAKTRDVTPHC